MRTILKEATVYFFAMVAVHTYSIIGVWLFVWFTCRSVMVEHDHHRVLIKNRNFRICEYAVNSEGNSAELKYPLLSCEVLVDCVLSDWQMRISYHEWLIPGLAFQLQSHLDTVVHDLFEEVRGHRGRAGVVTETLCHPPLLRRAYT